MKKISTILLAFISSCVIAQTWTSHNTGSVNSILEISFPTADTGYAVDDQGQFYKTFDGANTWSTVTPPALSTTIFFNSGKIGFAGADSMLYRTTNSGATWNVVHQDNRVSFTRIYFVDAMNGYAGGFTFTFDTLRLYKTTNGGITWTSLLAMQTYQPDQAFYFFNSSTGFWTNNSQIFSTTNGGSSFNSQYTDLVDVFLNLSFPNIDTGYAVGAQGGFVKSTDGGLTWAPTTYPGSASYDLYFFDGKKGFVCGGNGFNAGYVLQTSNSGASWSTSYSSVYTFMCMDFPNDTIGYVAGQNGIVLKFSGAPNGISNLQTENGINIFPNPASSIVNISFAEKINSENTIQIYNVEGKMIYEKKNCNQENSIDISNFAQGFYFAKISDGTKVSVSKFIRE